MNERLSQWMRSPFLWTGVAFLLYTLFAVFIAPWLYPGASIFAVIDVLQMDGQAATHFHAPLTEGCLHLIHGFTPNDVILPVFNAMSLLFGTLNVFLFGWVLTYLAKIFFEHSPSKAYLPTLLTWGIPMGSLIFMSSPEVLRAATHFQMQTLQLTFLLLATVLTCKAIYREQHNGFMLAMLLVGLVALDSKEGLMLSLVLFIAALVGYYLNVGKLSAKVFLLTFFAPVCFALLVLFGLYVKLLGGTAPALLSMRLYELLGLFQMTRWILLLALGILPFAVALSMLHRTSVNIRTFQLLIIYLTLTTVSVLVLLPVSFNPIRLVGHESAENFPLVLSTLMALTFGCVTFLTVAFRVIRQPAEGGEDNVLQRQRLRFVALFFTAVIPLTAVALTGISVTSTIVMDRAHTETTRTIIDAKIDALCKIDVPEVWIIDDSLLAQCIALRCYERKIQKLVFIPPERLDQPATPGSPLYQRLKQSKLVQQLLTPQQQKHLLQNGQLLGLHALTYLVHKAPASLKAIHTFSESTLWGDLESETHPLVSLYTGTSFRAYPKGAMDRHQLAVTAPAKAIEADVLGYPQDLGFSTFIQWTRLEACQHHLQSASLLAQTREATCEALALQHLSAAYACDPQRVIETRTGILNYLKDDVLAIQGIAVRAALNLKRAALTHPDVAAGSPLRLEAAFHTHHLQWLVLLPSYAHYERTRERGVSVRQMPAYQQLRQHNFMAENKPLSVEAQAALLKRYEDAVACIEQKRFTEAIALIDALAPDLNATTNTRLLALLATYQLNDGAFNDVRLKTLPRIRSIVGTEKNYYYLIIKAQLEKRQFRFREARSSFLQALDVKPANVAARARETVLSLDMRLGDKAAAKKHASDFLKDDINFSFAHYVLGSIALSEGRLNDAQSHLEQASVDAAVPVAVAYNDLAELHRRQQQYELACTYAQKAYETDHRLIIAHETVAAAAIALQQYERAEKEIDVALQLSQTLLPGEAVDPRILLTQATLYTKTQRNEQARQVFEKIPAQTLDPTSRQAYETLRKTL